MILKLSKFGEILISRPSGREAYLSFKAYLLDKKEKIIVIDFEKVKVLTPSWMDEFLTQLKKDNPKLKIIFRKSANPTVISSLDTLSST